ncbi:hypothetical protein M434DRAFT_9675 [Hypoxylon sp. CO27-5]|nr:hypothetical protein M434DRAFT_9675 [Hypoxylon sp. CO27-5]
MASQANNEEFPNQALVPYEHVTETVTLEQIRNSSSRAIDQGEATLQLLSIGGQELAPWCHNALQRAVLELLGRWVIIVRGSLRARQIASMRDSYVNALLIASRGGAVPRPCRACRQQALLYPDGYSRPFPVCTKLRGHFGGSCASCKFRDHAARCTVRDGGPEDPGELRFEPILPALPAPEEAPYEGAN